MSYPILSNEFQNLTLCMGISMRRTAVEEDGDGKGEEEGRGELQSRSLTWGARVMFKRQFWHPADPGPTFFNRRRRFNSLPSRAGGTTLLGSLCPPPEGLPRLLLTDRTKLAFPVSPKHWNCTNTLRILETATRLLYAIYRIESYALLKRWLSRDGFQVNTRRINDKFTRLCSPPRGEFNVDLYIAIAVYQFYYQFFSRRGPKYSTINVYILLR